MVPVMTVVVVHILRSGAVTDCISCLVSKSLALDFDTFNEIMREVLGSRYSIGDVCINASLRCVHMMR